MVLVAGRDCSRDRGCRPAEHVHGRSRAGPGADQLIIVRLTLVGRDRRPGDGADGVLGLRGLGTREVLIHAVNGEGREDANNRNDDHELDEGEATLIGTLEGTHRTDSFSTRGPDVRTTTPAGRAHQPRSTSNPRWRPHGSSTVVLAYARPSLSMPSARSEARRRSLVRGIAARHDLTSQRG